MKTSHYLVLNLAFGVIIFCIIALFIIDMREERAVFAEKTRTDEVIRDLEARNIELAQERDALQSVLRDAGLLNVEL